MTFEQALKQGDLDVARAILDELVELPDSGGLWMPECYADLAREYDRQGRHDHAIALHERAIELAWDSAPHPRSDIAEFHLRAGRPEEAAAIWAELKASDPDDVWLYNAAGLSYNEVGEHELAIAWLGEGIELAMRMDDPEGIVSQLSDVRRHSLSTLGRDLDELEQRVDPFLHAWRSEEQGRLRGGDPTVAESRRGLGGRPAQGLLRTSRRQHQMHAEPGRADPGRRADHRRRLCGLVRAARRGSRRGTSFVRRASHERRRSDRVAAWAQRAVLVRVRPQVQEVLRPSTGASDA